MLKKKKKRIKEEKALLGAIITISILILLSYSLNIIRNTNIIEYTLKNASDSILDAFSMVSYGNDSSVVKNNNNELKSEINELKNILNLKNTYTNYELENATVMVRNKSYWLDNLIIDKGKKEGIKKDMAVITDQGLVGIVSKVYRNSSEIKLITTSSKKYKLTIYIETKEGDFVGFIDKYDKNKNELIIKDIDKNSNIQIGNKVMTSGMNLMFPKGIYIGDVKDIKDDEYNLSKIVYVKTKQNFNKIHYVAVVKKIND